MKINSKKKIVIGSDFSTNSGEGILGNDYIKTYSRANNKVMLKKKFFFFNKFSKKSLFHKYIQPLILSLYARLNSKSEFIFVNYLPLWNFLVFLILPKNTILGPITGSNIVKEKNILHKFLRKYCFPLLYNISLLIIKRKFKQIVFSTNLLKENLNQNKFEAMSNYVLNCFNFRKINKNIKKKYDVVFYFRRHSNKFDNNLNRIIKIISNKKKICILGDKFNHHSKNIFNLGYINRSRAQRIMRQSKFAICPPENLYSLFAIDSYNNGCHLIVEKNLQKYEFTKSKKIFYFKYKYSRENVKNLMKILNRFKNYKDLDFEKKIRKKKQEIKKYIKN